MDALPANEPTQESSEPEHALLAKPPEISEAHSPANAPSNPTPPMPKSIANPHTLVTPTFTFLLIAVNVLVFIVTLSYPILLDWGANNHTLVFQFGEYYRLATSMFLHANFEHVLLNMVCLYSVGRVVESYYGHTRFLLAYFLGGLCGSISSAVLGDPSIVAVGASGAVFALFGAEVFYYQRFQHVFGGDGKLGSSAITIVLNFLNGIRPDSGIDNWAHLGGLVGGMLVALITAPHLALTQLPDPSGKMLVYEPRRRNLGGFEIATVATFVALLFTTVTTSSMYSVRVVEVGNISVTAPTGWRTITTFEAEPFCEQSGVECLLGVTTNGIFIEIDRFSGTDIALSSIEEFDAAVAQVVETEGAEMLFHDSIKVDERDAIQSVYRVGEHTRMFVFVRDGNTIVRFYVDSLPNALDQYRPQLNAIIESIRFDEP
jgi:membrane associated rhomboid family serine protease